MERAFLDGADLKLVNKGQKSTFEMLKGHKPLLTLKQSTVYIDT